MALWDKRDSRWQVEDRQDGSNVNGWHWEERNCMSWSKDRLAELLAPLPATSLDAALGSASITTIKEVTGEAYLTMRKGNKKFAVFDLSVTLAWEGHWLEGLGHTKAKGDCRLTEVSSTNEPDEYLFEVTSETPEGTSDADREGAGREALRQAVAALRPVIFERLEQYVLDIQQL